MPPESSAAATTIFALDFYPLATEGDGPGTESLTIQPGITK